MSKQILFWDKVLEISLQNPSLPQVDISELIGVVLLLDLHLFCGDIKRLDLSNEKAESGKKKGFKDECKAK